MTLRGLDASEWFKEHGDLTPFQQVIALEGVIQGPTHDSSIRLRSGETLSSVRKCNLCGSALACSVEQVRRADEGMSTVYRCPKCNP